MPTEFQNRVYEVVRRIPRGRVTTYKALAEYLGCGSCQAVGQALRCNPYAPEVPCHRVIAADLSLGGFKGEKSREKLRRKERLLAEEGVKFKNNHLLEVNRLLTLVDQL